VAVDLAVAWIANSDFANHPAVHLSMEDDALFFLYAADAPDLLALMMIFAFRSRGSRFVARIVLARRRIIRGGLPTRFSPKASSWLASIDNASLPTSQATNAHRHHALEYPT
jgi:hypothetical protein